ncbi:hypothetical protein COU17_03050 [Candidatus Kaiserbacteria bacterium CG10_big_fil_rev_8_21_14_0_10_49_17]|uniref:Carbamoyl phosphate synthase ATP-binding domain-containing protein n=1 Tax=Candidatus Kaiserbacteria bacterium CG10_big_fil_rev_8_21_14_0_10_49_17 TaxID=1974609 RepID=A0A2M6WDN3_9BACT|nr:MAG: hypothetical protein COU17_03050 [Candidatus Kaiserbacteria bacterium CG10_big_fil_rev_8_21_14_0_10_49_17]
MTAGFECCDEVDVSLAMKEIGYPVKVIPSFSLGYGEAEVANSPAELASITTKAFQQSPLHRIRIETME